ncbi:cell division protein FtsZ [Marine Group I thaumarchaeote]|uniref:Cell division protein FtsZ n=1 Tax=Marine Group I thaumarchaeote TaxID=2511932 RepID=A0A7K4MZF2_9ARCH|nr:cell division protein FtsZ [Marine Group I thaumarchaeote]
MTFQLTEPILLIGLGGVGASLAEKAKKSLNSDCLLISHDQKDLTAENSIKISTKSVVNPSTHLIRGSTLETSDEIKKNIANYSTVILISNLAGKAGAGIGPIVSRICKQEQKNLLSFTIMPFKFEKERIFQSGIALKRIRQDSQCTIVVDNDALLDSNPDLTQKQCYDISNKAIESMMHSLKSSEISEDTNILSTGKATDDIESSLKDSLRMLYEDAPPNSIKRSILYVYGGSNIPVGVLNTISNITGGTFDENSTHIEMSSEESKVIMLSSIQGETRFDKYDPLGIISPENTIDWDEPECSIDCKLDLKQLE